jgi:hypothetical protein
VKRPFVAIIALGLLGSSCVFRDSRSGPADELTELASRVEKATYAAVYRFAFVKQFAPGQTIRMEITQQPPVTVRRIDTTTKPEEGKALTVTAWFIKRADGNYVCNEFPEAGIRCQKDPISTATFGSAKLDVFFDAPREARAFTQVRKAARRDRFRGHIGTCYEAIPTVPSPEPASPAPTPERFRYELCYADDGILLQGRRTTLDEGDAAERSESFVELISLSRVVEPGELKLPGDITDVGDLPR